MKPEPEHTQSRAQIVELCEELQGTRYDECSLKWDVLLKILNLSLCYQVGVAIALNGTWRNARNLKAYIATVAVRESAKNGLIFNEERYGRSPLDAGPISNFLKRTRDRSGKMRSTDELADWLVYRATEGSVSGVSGPDDRPTAEMLKCGDHADEVCDYDDDDD